MTDSTNRTWIKIKYVTSRSLFFTFSLCLCLTARCTKSNGRVRSSRMAEALNGIAPSMTAKNRVHFYDRLLSDWYMRKKYFFIIPRHWDLGGFNYKGLPSELNLYLKVRNSGNTKNTWHWLTNWKPSSKKQLLKVLKRWQHILYDGKIFNKTVACHPHDNKNSRSWRGG